MAFRFKFDSLLTYRNHVFQKEQQEFVNKLKTAKDVEREYERIKMEKSILSRMIELRGQEGVKVEEYSLLCETLEALEQRLVEYEKKLKKALRELEDQRERLIKAKKEVEILEIIKEQEEKEYKKRESKKEQKIIDEICLNGGRYEK